MALAFGLTSARNLFAKLQRDAALLEQEVTSDRAFNFVVTGHSLIDWVLKDPSVPPPAKAELQTMRADHWLLICRDLANGNKHFELDPQKTKNNPPITSSAPSAQGFGLGRYGKGNCGEGEESILIKLNDGTTYDFLELVRQVIHFWEDFFATYSI